MLFYLSKHNNKDCNYCAKRKSKANPADDKCHLANRLFVEFCLQLQNDMPSSPAELAVHKI